MKQLGNSHLFQTDHIENWQLLTKKKVIAAKFKGLSVLSAVLRGRDAVRPERAETTAMETEQVA